MRKQIWKLQDAKARFSELVRRARNGELQRVSVHGKEAVVVVDPARYEIKKRPRGRKTLADFIQRSRRYRHAEDVEFESRLIMDFPPPAFADDEEKRD